MTGAPFSREDNYSPPERSLETNSSRLDRYIDYSYAKYIGGHPLYTKPRDTGVYIYHDGIEVVNPSIVIPYSAIMRIENMDEKKIDREKVVLGMLFFTPLAIHAAIKKKKHIYTIIQYMENEELKQPNLGSTDVPHLFRYHEGGDKITIVLDFDADINRIQNLIYNKMIEYKRR